jgi:hypothetical protein
LKKKFILSILSFCGQHFSFLSSKIELKTVLSGNGKIIFIISQNRFFFTLDDRIEAERERHIRQTNHKFATQLNVSLVASFILFLQNKISFLFSLNVFVRKTPRKLF